MATKPEPLRLRTTSSWIMLAFGPMYIFGTVFASVFAGVDVPQERLLLWVFNAPPMALFAWWCWLMVDYRRYAREMLPLVNGCPVHPNYHGKSKPVAECEICQKIRVSRLKLFPEEER